MRKEAYYATDKDILAAVNANRVSVARFHYVWHMHGWMSYKYTFVLAAAKCCQQMSNRSIVVVLNQLQSRFIIIPSAYKQSNNQIRGLLCINECHHA